MSEISLKISTLYSEDALLAQYVQASSGFEQRAGRDIAVFVKGKEIIDNGNIFHSGTGRAVDRLIVSDVIKMLSEERVGPLRILEVACGGTFGKYGHYGAPWLSRKLKNAFGDKVEIHVSDRDLDPLVNYLNVHELLFFYTPTSGNVFLHAERVEISNPWRFEDKLFSVPLTFELIQNLPPEIIKTFRKVMLEFKNFRGEEGQIFMRPLIDSKLEKNLFNIHRLGGVDYLRLLESFPQQKFDLIFGRHLDQLSIEKNKRRKKLQDLEASAKNVLSSHGKCILHFYEEELKNDFVHSFRSFPQLIR